MAVWLIRAGDDSQYEQRFFKDQRVYLTCEGLYGEDFTETPDYAGIRNQILERFKEQDETNVGSLADIVSEFVLGMAVRDLVLTPRQYPNTLAIGAVISPYGCDPAAEPPFNHLRDVKWLALDVPFTAFSSELQDYFAALTPVAQIKIANATAQVQKILGQTSQVTLEPHITTTTSLGAKPSVAPPTAPPQTAPTEDGRSQPLEVATKPTPAVAPIAELAKPATQNKDCVLEGLGLEAISQVIAEDIERHGVITLIRGILEAGGLTLFSLNADINSPLFMAAAGAFGLDRPSTCVQVLPSNAVCDTLTFSQFYGTVQGQQAEQGLLVSWSGFDPQVEHDAKALGARIRLWTRKEIVKNLLDHYPSLDEQVRQRIPLKRIWIPSNIL